MRIVKSLLPVLVIASLLSSLSYAAVPDRISGVLTSGQTVPLRGNVHHKALPKFDQGPVDPAMQLGTITLTTVPTAAQQKAITRLLAQQQDRKSSNYHKWLTPEQYADRFGLSQPDMQQMAAWLKSKGFTMIQQARSRNWISFTGTAAQVQNAFGAEIHHFNVNGELHYANATAPQIPTALSGVVTGFRGLDDFRPKPHGIRRNLHPDYNSSNFGNLIAPGDIATIYDINALYTAGFDGTGQKLAVMGQTDIYLADLTDFRTGFGLSAISCTTNSSNVITACSDPHLSYVLDGADPGLSTTGDISEADLDLEWSGAVARGAQIIFVNSTDTFTSYYYAVAKNLAPVISLSYGFCEFDDNILSSDEAVLQQASLQGISFVNSSGDAGAAECENSSTVTTTPPANLATQGIAVSYPASSPEVTGAGGTAIPLANFTSQYWSTSTTNPTDGGTALSYIPEQAWNDNDEIAQFCSQQAAGSSGAIFCANGSLNGAVPGWVPIVSAETAQEDIGISSTGGGASNCSVQTSDFSACVSGFPKPSWQTVTITGQTTRLSPDVSFLATPNFPGYIFCTQLSELSGDTGTGSSCAPGGAAGITNALNLNNPSLIGGTSASAPIFAGMVAVLNQYLAGASSPGLGNVNPMLYSLAQTQSNGAFHRVTTGDNTVYCVVGTPSTQPLALQCPGTGILGFQASNSDPTTGYNMVTGLGSVDLDKLAIAWAATLPGFTLAPSPASLSTAAGQSTGSTTITITPANGFTGTVTFSCSAGLPAGATCVFTPVNSTSATLVVQTTPTMAAVNNASVTVKGTSGVVSSTTTISLTVTATTESFFLTTNLTSVSVTQGALSGPVVLTVNSTTGFINGNTTTAPITYTCSGLPSAATCNFAPGSVSSATSVTLTVQTTPPTGAMRQSVRGMRIFYATLLPGLFGIVFTFGSRKRPLRGLRLLGLIVVLGFSTLWLASCGGSSSSGVSNPGTPKGTSTVTVNASTSGTAPITGSPVVTFQLTVN
jgi:subtilase family serine protease